MTNIFHSMTVIWVQRKHYQKKGNFVIVGIQQKERKMLNRTMEIVIRLDSMGENVN